MTTTQPPAGMRWREIVLGNGACRVRYTHRFEYLVCGTEAWKPSSALDAEMFDVWIDLRANNLEPAPPAPVERDEVWKVVSGLLDRVWNVAKSYERYGNLEAFPAWEGTDTITAAILRAVQDRIDTAESAHRADREAVLAACGVTEQTADTLAGEVRAAIAQGTPTATLSIGPTILDPQWRWVGDRLETRYPDESTWKPAHSMPADRWREIVAMRHTSTTAEDCIAWLRAHGWGVSSMVDSPRTLLLIPPAERRGVE